MANIDNRLEFEHADPRGPFEPTVLRTKLAGGGDVRFGLGKFAAISLARRFTLIGSQLERGQRRIQPDQRRGSLPGDRLRTSRA